MNDTGERQGVHFAPQDLAHIQFVDRLSIVRRALPDTLPLIEDQTSQRTCSSASVFFVTPCFNPLLIKQGSKLQSLESMEFIGLVLGSMHSAQH